MGGVPELREKSAGFRTRVFRYHNNVIFIDRQEIRLKKKFIRLHIEHLGPGNRDEIFTAKVQHIQQSVLRHFINKTLDLFVTGTNNRMDLFLFNFSRISHGLPIGKYMQNS